jgi:hypothetical protein
LTDKIYRSTSLVREREREREEEEHVSFHDLIKVIVSLSFSVAALPACFDLTLFHPHSYGTSQARSFDDYIKFAFVILAAKRIDNDADDNSLSHVQSRFRNNLFRLRIRVFSPITNRIDSLSMVFDVVIISIIDVLD